MNNPRISKKHGCQRGYAMLTAVATIGVIAASSALTALFAGDIGTRQTAATAQALARAKQALISRAGSDANHPGSLPCPDAATNIAGSNVPNDGIADLLAGNACPSMIGRLPWRTLGLPDLRDADGERLWYMVAPAFHDSSAKIINAGTSGQINAYECAEDAAAAPVWPCAAPRTLTATPWVAVVFAPGKVLAAQQRDAARAGDSAQYLESYNAADPLRLRLGGSAHNDRYAAISTDDVFALAQRRLAGELQAVLAAYYTATAAQGQARLPWPAAQCASSTQCDATPLSTPLAAIARGFLPSDDALLNQLMAAQSMGWFDHNHWRSSFSYTIDTQCSSAGMPAQCGTTLAAAGNSVVPAGSTLVGGNAGTVARGTRAILEFGGVTGGTGKTRVVIALQ